MREARARMSRPRGRSSGLRLLCTAEGVKALKQIDAHIRRRLRAIIIRQRKRPRFLFRHLRSRGVSIKAAAGAAFSGRGRWFRSNHPGMTRAYPPAWFIGGWCRLPPDGMNLTPACRRSGSRCCHSACRSKSLCEPHVRFCERRGGVILCTYSTSERPKGFQPRRSPHERSDMRERPSRISQPRGRSSGLRLVAVEKRDLPSRTSPTNDRSRSHWARKDSFGYVRPPNRVVPPSLRSVTWSFSSRNTFGIPPP